MTGRGKAPAVGIPSLLECPSPEESARLCARLGLDFVELNMNLPECGPERLQAAELIRIARETGVGFSIHLDERLDPFDFNPYLREAAAETVSAALRAARGANMRTLTLHLSEGVYFTLPEERAYLYGLYLDEYLAAVAAFRERVESEAQGEVLLCIENTGGFPSFQREAIDLLLASPAFALCRDVGHEHSAGYVYKDFLDERADRIAHMHLHDARGKDNHLPPGEGDVDIAAHLAFARERGLSCVIEVKTVEALERSVEAIRRMMG